MFESMPPPATLPYYMDESVSGRITEPLLLGGIDALRAQDHAEGASDEDVLNRAIELKRVLVTQDTDHLAIGTQYQREGRAFTGIVFIRKDVSIGQAVSDLKVLANTTNLDDWKSRVEYLPI
jgi:predicted nuclease of predicted toxin-antitoxin system